MRRELSAAPGSAQSRGDCAAIRKCLPQEPQPVHCGQVACRREGAGGARARCRRLTHSFVDSSRLTLIPRPVMLHPNQMPSGETAGSCAPLRWRCTLCVGVHAYFLCRCVVRVRLCRVFRGPATGEGGPLCLIRVRSQTLSLTLAHRRALLHCGVPETRVSARVSLRVTVWYLSVCGLCDAGVECAMVCESSVPGGECRCHACHDFGAQINKTKDERPRKQERPEAEPQAQPANGQRDGNTVKRK